MLVAAGGRVPGPPVRNWDNPRGHHESGALVRLNEEVLAHSGGHWLQAPPSVQWTAEQAAERDRLLAEPDVVLKDPRTLLVWPFWAEAAPQRVVGVVRHPLAVARSLLGWRGLAIDEGLRLWLDHDFGLEASGAPVLAFDHPRDRFVADGVAAARALGLVGEAEAIGAAYAAELVHHGVGEGPVGDPGLLAEAVARFARYHPPEAAAKPFPWIPVEAALAALPTDPEAAGRWAAQAMAAGEPAAVIAAVAPAFLKQRAGDRLLPLLDAAHLPDALDGLLRGKIHLAASRGRDAVDALRRATAVEEPLYEARHLLPAALQAAGRRRDADRALAELADHAIYAFRVHARRAELAWARQDREAAFALLEAALADAPARRKGRLLHRRAAWKTILGDPEGAAADRALAAEVDPSFAPGGYAGENRNG